MFYIATPFTPRHNYNINNKKSVHCAPHGCLRQKGRVQCNEDRGGQSASPRPSQVDTKHKKTLKLLQTFFAHLTRSHRLRFGRSPAAPSVALVSKFILRAGAICRDTYSTRRVWQVAWGWSFELRFLNRGLWNAFEIILFRRMWLTTRYWFRDKFAFSVYILFFLWLNYQ